MRFSLMMTFWLLALGSASGLLGVAFAQASGTDPGLMIPIEDVAVIHLNPSALTFPMAFVLVGLMAIRSLPAILKAWEPTVRIEHMHVLKDENGDALSRRDLEEILSDYMRRREG